eukprot:m.259246 g.259246  ORF g.259246 m.259246 type:complete len:725 (-) comp22285_c0_seq1:196-2370(-)
MFALKGGPGGHGKRRAARGTLDVYLAHDLSTEGSGRDHFAVMSEVCGQLRMLGYEVWFEQAATVGSYADMCAVIDKVRAVILFVSDRYATRISNRATPDDYCVQELQYILQHPAGKPIITVVLDKYALDSITDDTIRSRLSPGTDVVDMSIGAQLGPLVIQLRKASIVPARQEAGSEDSLRSARPSLEKSSFTDDDPSEEAPAPPVPRRPSKDSLLFSTLKKDSQGRDRRASERGIAPLMEEPRDLRPTATSGNVFASIAMKRIIDGYWSGTVVPNPQPTTSDDALVPVGNGLWRGDQMPGGLRGPSYNGEMSPRGLFHGPGVYEFPDQVRLDGYFVDGVLDTSKRDATIKYPDGSTYIGQIQPANVRHQQSSCLVIHGQGRLSTLGGSQVYKGAFKDGKKEGHGVETMPNGSKYDGEFKADERCGHGRKTWDSGSVHEGHYRHGLPWGYGTHVHADKSRYIGGFREGKRAGKGCVIDESDIITSVGLFLDGAQALSFVECEDARKIAAAHAAESGAVVNTQPSAAQSGAKAGTAPGPSFDYTTLYTCGGGECCRSLWYKCQPPLSAARGSQSSLIEYCTWCSPCPCCYGAGPIRLRQYNASGVYPVRKATDSLEALISSVCWNLFCCLGFPCCEKQATKSARVLCVTGTVWYWCACHCLPYWLCNPVLACAFLPCWCAMERCHCCPPRNSHADCRRELCCRCGQQHPVLCGCCLHCVDACPHL